MPLEVSIYALKKLDLWWLGCVDLWCWMSCSSDHIGQRCEILCKFDAAVVDWGALAFVVGERLDAPPHPRKWGSPLSFTWKPPWPVWCPSSGWQGCGAEKVGVPSSMVIFDDVAGSDELCSNFFSETLELQNKMEIELLSKFSWCLIGKWSEWEGEGVLSSSGTAMQVLPSPFNYWCCIKWPAQAISYLCSQKHDAANYLHHCCVICILNDVIRSKCSTAVMCQHCQQQWAWERGLFAWLNSPTTIQTPSGSVAWNSVKVLKITQGLFCVCTVGDVYSHNIHSGKFSGQVTQSAINSEQLCFRRTLT